MNKVYFVFKHSSLKIYALWKFDATRIIQEKLRQARTDKFSLLFLESLFL